VEPSNPIGHFENIKVLNFNEGLLNKAGTDWKNPTPLTKCEFFTINRVEIEVEIDNLLTDLIENEKVTALKEPRISLLLDLWKPALTKQIDDLKIVITLRHPSEVASSLNKRDGLNTIIGLQLWGHAMLNGIRFARELPNFFLYYEELIENSLDVTTDLSKFLNNPENTAAQILPATTFVHPNFRHNKVSIESLSALKITTEIYNYVRNFRRATTQDFPDNLLEKWEQRLNAVSLELNRNSLILTDTQQRDELTQQRDELTQQRDELTQQRDELTQQRDELTQQRDELIAELGMSFAERDQIAAERDAANAKLEAVVNSRIWRFTKFYREFRCNRP
jgi:hypothetical protein